MPGSTLSFLSRTSFLIGTSPSASVRSSAASGEQKNSTFQRPRSVSALNVTVEDHISPTSLYNECLEGLNSFQQIAAFFCFAGCVVADSINPPEKYRIIAALSLSGFPFAKNQNAGLDTCAKWHKCLNWQADDGPNFGLACEPVPDVSRIPVGNDSVRKHDAHASTRPKQLKAPLQSQDFQRNAVTAFTEIELAKMPDGIAAQY